MTVELAEHLLQLDKYLVDGGELMNNYTLDIQFPMSFRLPISTPEDLDQNLLIDIKESGKKSLKISLHHQDNGTQNGIIRIDYNGRHINPSEVLPSLPEKFRPFAGQWLDNYEGHIHYVVNGYKPLAWAIPLEIDKFSVTKLNGREDYSRVLYAFFKKINLKTRITFNYQMQLI